MKIKGAKNDPFFLAWYKIGENIQGLMVIQSSNKRKAEEGFVGMAEAHVAQHPHCPLTLEKLVLLESPEQVDRAKAELKGKYPKQLFADEYCPENPNALLFKPLVASDADVESGRAEEALIRYLCEGHLLVPSL